MSWWGKALGGAFGFALAGPLGALIGAALGHGFDKGLDTLPEPGPAQPNEQVQAAFFTATFSVMGHLAKADGRVSEEEIGIATALMDRMGLAPAQRTAARRLFSEGKAASFDLAAVLGQLRRECHRSRNLLRMFIEIQLQAAYADGSVHPNERRILGTVCEHVGVSEAELARLERLVRVAMQFRDAAGGRGGGARPAAPGKALEDAYAVLGIPRGASDDEVKRAYRRLMSQHHPDKLVSRGLPEEMMQIAKERTQQIKAAYDRVKDDRKMR